MQKLHPTICIRLFLQFISSISTMTVLPYIIIYFAGKLGSTITGVLFLCVMSSTVLGSICGGYLSDKIGRKRIIIFAEFFIFFGYIGAALANYNWGMFPYLTFLFFICIQFSNGVVEPVYQALVIDVSKPDQRKTIYTYSYWLRNLGVAIGSMIGAFFFFTNLFLLLLGVAFTTIISLLITIFYIEETYHPTLNIKESKDGSHLQMWREYIKILKNKFFAVFLIASLFIVSVEEQLTNYIGVRLATELPETIPLASFFSFEVDGINLLGILKAENTILVICFTLMVMNIVKKWNDRFILLMGLFLFFGGYIVISFTTTPFILIIAMFIASIGEIMYIPIQQTILANIVPSHARSTYMALYSIAIICGMSAAGIFLMISSWFPPIILTAFISLMGMISFLLFYKLTFRRTVLSVNQKNAD
ncbi:MFS transporter [Lysinibacillus mangiferihumi]|nr:MFS transporter [Lysinibacillus mangiferihumi]